MIYTERAHRVKEYPGTAAGLAELAADICGPTWTLCTGFEWNGLLFLNDSTSENTAQEYAVIDRDTSRQVESFTTSWMEPIEFAAAVAATIRDPFSNRPVELHAHADGPCRLCA